MDYRRRDFNQLVLSTLLRHRAELFETPVYYFPISPEKIRRTTVGDGVRSLMTILRGRFSRLAPAPTVPAAESVEVRSNSVGGTEAAPLPK